MNNLRSAENIFWFTFVGRQEGSNDGARETERERGDERAKKQTSLLAVNYIFFFWLRNVTI